MMVASTSALLTPPAPHTSVAEPAARSNRQAAVLLSLGLVMTLLAAGAAYRKSDGPSGRDRRPVTSARFEGAGVFIQGPGDLAVVDVVYEPGQTSGWHTHRGLHAVAVLSGTLTMYDRQCRPERYVPGKPYVGGHELHLARNETAEPVVMVVTYVNATGPAAADDVRPGAPPGCDVR